MSGGVRAWWTLGLGLGLRLGLGVRAGAEVWAAYGLAKTTVFTMFSAKTDQKHQKKAGFSNIFKDAGAEAGAGAEGWG